MPRFREARRQRYLSAEELGRLGAALRELEAAREASPFALAALRLLLFTGARPSEVTGHRWEHVGLGRGVLNLPDSKTGQKVIYLSPPAAAILAELPGIEGDVRGERARLRPIGVIRPTLETRGKAPKQGADGAPDAWLEVLPFAVEALDGLAAGGEVVVLTWLHLARRDTLKVHPRSDRTQSLTGVFATRSPDRPNPVGLHRVTIRRIEKARLRIGPIEALDGTPVIDMKPVLGGPHDF